MSIYGPTELRMGMSTKRGNEYNCIEQIGKRNGTGVWLVELYVIFLAPQGSGLWKANRVHGNKAKCK